MATNVLAAKDINTSMPPAPVPNDAQHIETDAAPNKPDLMSLEHHRQVLQSKMEKEGGKFVSPSDNIMSPCTAKLSALRNKQVGKVKPKSLFARASAKKLGSAAQLEGNNSNAAKLGDNPFVAN